MKEDEFLHSLSLAWSPAFSASTLFHYVHTPSSTSSSDFSATAKASFYLHSIPSFILLSFFFLFSSPSFSSVSSLLHHPILLYPPFFTLLSCCFLLSSSWLPYITTTLTNYFIHIEFTPPPPLHSYGTRARWWRWSWKGARAGRGATVACWWEDLTLPDAPSPSGPCSSPAPTLTTSVTASPTPCSWIRGSAPSGKSGG